MLCFDAIPESVKKLLARLAPHPALENFALGDGTSLALRFGHRLSVDLDFFTPAPFDADDLFLMLRTDDAIVTGRAVNTLMMNMSGVKVDLLRHAYPLLEPVVRLDGISLISLSDLAAMKLNAIANRGSKKDFYDLVELLQHYPLQQMLGFFSDKYQAMDPFTVIRSLAWFEDAELEPDPVPLAGQTWAKVKESVTEALERL